MSVSLYVPDRNEAQELIAMFGDYPIDIIEASCDVPTASYADMDYIGDDAVANLAAELNPGGALPVDRREKTPC